MARISGEMEAAIVRQKELMTTIGNLTAQRDSLQSEVTTLTARKATLSEKQMQVIALDETIAQQTRARSELETALAALRQSLAAAPPPNTAPIETTPAASNVQGR